MTCEAVTHKISERRYAYFPCHVNKSNIRNTPLEQQLKKKNSETYFSFVSRENEKVENNGNCKAVCVTRKRNISNFYFGRFSYNLGFIPFLFLRMKQNQRSML